MISNFFSLLGSLLAGLFLKFFKRNPNLTINNILTLDQKDENLQAKASAGINDNLNSVDRVIDELHHKSDTW